MLIIYLFFIKRRFVIFFVIFEESLVTFSLYFCFSLTVNEALYIFYALNSDCESDSDHEREKCNKIIIQHPVESAVAEKDKDLDKNDEVQGIFDHLPTRIISTSCEINHHIDSDTSDSNNDVLQSSSS